MDINNELLRSLYIDRSMFAKLSPKDRNTQLYYDIASAEYRKAFVFAGKDVMVPRSHYISFVIDFGPDEQSIRAIPDRFRKDSAFVWDLIRQCPHVYEFLDPEFMKDKNIIRYVLTKCHELIEKVPVEFLDEELVISIIQCNPCVFARLNSLFKNNRRVVDAALKHDSANFNYITKEMSKDRNIVMSLVKSDPMSLCHLDPVFRNDFGIVEKAVSNDGMALKYASKSLQGDLYIVSLAIINDWRAYRFASDFIRNNYDLALNYYIRVSDPSNEYDHRDDIPKHLCELFGALGIMEDIYPSEIEYDSVLDLLTDDESDSAYNENDSVSDGE